jgi:hypothetical protein
MQDGARGTCTTSNIASEGSVGSRRAPVFRKRGHQVVLRGMTMNAVLICFLDRSGAILFFLDFSKNAIWIDVYR